MGSSWEDEELDWSDSAGKATGHSRDMGTICEHVMALVGRQRLETSQINFLG